MFGLTIKSILYHLDSPFGNDYLDNVLMIVRQNRDQMYDDHNAVN